VNKQVKEEKKFKGDKEKDDDSSSNEENHDQNNLKRSLKKEFETRKIAKEELKKASLQKIEEEPPIVVQRITAG